MKHEQIKYSGTTASNTADSSFYASSEWASGNELNIDDGSGNLKKQEELLREYWDKWQNVPYIPSPYQPIPTTYPSSFDTVNYPLEFEVINKKLAETNKKLDEVLKKIDLLEKLLRNVAKVELDKLNQHLEGM